MNPPTFTPAENDASDPDEAELDVDTAISCAAATIAWAGQGSKPPRETE